MRRLLWKVVALVALVAGTAAASPVEAGLCDDAKEGTYESNICWLMETNFDEVTPRVKLFLIEAQTYEAMVLAFGKTLTGVTP